jgi:ADP-heptose:LPS heptosyltransferase
VEGLEIRALVVVCRYLGDVLLATPLARALKDRGYAVDWLVAPQTEKLLHGQSFCDTAYAVDAATSWRGQIALARRLWHRYDKAFVLTASDRPMLLAAAATSRIYALIPRRRWQDAWKRRLAYRWLAYEGGRHMARCAIDLGLLDNLKPYPYAGLDWDAADQETVRGLLPWHDIPFVLLHPFARWTYKLWHPQGWRELMARLLDQGFNVVLTASPAEAAAARALVRGQPGGRVCVLAGRLNWRQLAALSALARVYVGLDTANTHLAAGTGTPVIALFGPTDPRLWGPWPHGYKGRTPWRAAVPNGVQRQGNVSLLQGGGDCVPCQLEGCERHPDSSSLCLQQLGSDRVWQEILFRLGG